jgi:enoyl-CoA hydratase/carnithine racemase
MSDNTNPEIMFEQNGGIATIRFNRPRVMNAMNSALSSAVLRALEGADSWRVLIITGDHRAFSSGADLKESRDPGSKLPRPRDVCEAVARLPIPVIAAIEGHCLAGGLELALGCDLLVASETARFALAETLRGFIPGGGGTQRLPRRVGPGRAKELMFFGTAIDAHTALSWGLVNRVVAAGEAYNQALEMAKQLAKAAPLALREIKRQVNEGMDMPLAQALRLEREGNVYLDGTYDAQEGRTAFKEKRAPQFKGE